MDGRMSEKATKLELEKYRRKFRNPFSIILSQREIDFFQTHMDIKRAEFIRAAIDRLIDIAEQAEEVVK